MHAEFGVLDKRNTDFGIGNKGGNMLPNVKGIGESYQNKIFGHTKKEAEKKGSSSVSKNAADKEVATEQVPVSGDLKTDKLSLSSVANKKTEKKEALTPEDQLSDKAKDYLAKLRKSRKNVDFRISEKGMENNYLAKKTNKEFTIVLTNEEIEKMATDKAFEKKQLYIIDKTMKDMLKASLGLGEDNGSGKTNTSDIKDIALKLKEDGSTELIASLEKSSKSAKRIAAEKAKKRETEKLEEKRLEKKQAAEKDKKKIADKSEEKKSEKETVKRVEVKANTIEELVEKMKNIDWDKIPETEKDSE